jgi:hypothetical protein
MAKVNWGSLSNSDLEAISNNQWGSVSEAGLKLVSNEEYGTAETLGRSFERGVTSTLRGLSQLFGNDLDFYNRAFGYQTDLEKEQEFRTMMDTNTGAAVLGVVAGSIADPTNLVPIGTAKTVGQFVKQGAAVGGVAGALEPTYEEEYDDSRLTNITIGGVLGAGIGGAIGKLVNKGQAVKTAQVEGGGPVIKTADEVSETAEEAAPPVINQQQFTNLLDIQRRIEVGELVTPAEQRFLRDFEDQLPPLTDDAVRAFEIQSRINEGALITPAEQRFLSDFNKLDKPIFQVPASTAKFVSKQDATQTPINQASVTDGGVISAQKAMSEVEQVAFKTGDYRDFLNTSGTRMASVSPTQFARMIDPSNPYRNSNVNVLASKSAEDADVLSQIEGALSGRFKYEKQTGKTWSQTFGDELVPEDIAVEALMNKKIQEILPPEVMSQTIKATRSAIEDLRNARELARIARERGSDEGYAVLQAMMTKASGLLAAVEGNASNLGRALNFQKALQKVIKENGNIAPFLGGRSC